uniref:Serine-threonine/tyrosine-protein kinase catalytic domain-containing protein n=1 Tax=Acrobeloides nanus TaxID=290746 RepID=A0A914CS30_9BILA
MERDKVVIEYEKKLGAGAFCNVYQGRIIGDAPIKKIYYNLIAVNHFNNCDVAIKMLPSFADDIARSDFNQEYLNSVGCIHRDVAARNVLVNQGNVCKVC